MCCVDLHYSSCVKVLCQETASGDCNRRRTPVCNNELEIVEIAIMYSYLYVVNKSIHHSKPVFNHISYGNIIHFSFYLPYQIFKLQWQKTTRLVLPRTSCWFLFCTNLWWETLGKRGFLTLHGLYFTLGCWGINIHNSYFRLYYKDWFEIRWKFNWEICQFPFLCTI
jgi:hypothetical protein